MNIHLTFLLVIGVTWLKKCKLVKLVKLSGGVSKETGMSLENSGLYTKLLHDL